VQTLQRTDFRFRQKQLLNNFRPVLKKKREENRLATAIRKIDTFQIIEIITDREEIMHNN